MMKEDIMLAMNEIDDEYIEASECTVKKGFKIKTSVVLAAALMLLFSVTAMAAAGFFNTVSGGELVFMEAVGGYSGDVYKVTFDIDVAKDAGFEIEEYYVPMYLEENWTDVQGEATNWYSVLVYDNYEENLFAIFRQEPVHWHTGEGGYVYSMPAGTKCEIAEFDFDGDKILCLEVQPGQDGYTADPFGTRILFWSDGYNFFSLETRLNLDDEVLREILRSIVKVDDITDYSVYKLLPNE